MADNARKLGSKVTVFGRFNPDQPFYYYGNGWRLLVHQQISGLTTRLLAASLRRGYSVAQSNALPGLVGLAQHVVQTAVH